MTVTPEGRARRARSLDSLTRLSRLRRRRSVQTAATLSLVLLGPILALATYLVLGPLDSQARTGILRLVLMADLVYILVLAGLVILRVARLVAARRVQSAGSRLHLRLTGVFALMALLPTVTVAVFAVLSVNMGLEAWFSERVKSVVGASLAAAKAYEDEQRRGLEEDALALVNFINLQARARGGTLDDGTLRIVLGQGQARIQRGLREAFIIDGQGRIRARGERSYLFDYEKPGPDDMKAAREKGIVLFEDWQNDEFRALVPISALPDRYLLVTRLVDGKLLSLLDETQATARFYQQKETERGRVLFDFGLIYIAFAMLLILASVWLGLWFAERLSRPVGRLAGAAQRVGAGDLDVQVHEEEGDDEISMLARYFNQMTRQLKAQREALLENTRQIERRRRLFDSVLGSVTSGVVGLDSEGRVTFVNRSAERLLGWHQNRQSVPLTVAVPEFGPLFERLRSGQAGNVVQGEVKVVRGGKQEILLVRMARRTADTGEGEGYVVAFDDVTDLVSAQRLAAWGDVARRIAHEIKNPLTPIQLSAERIRRKFGPRLGEESDQLEQMTGVIVRQTNDLRRIIDEFSRFARMPAPELRRHDVARILRDAVTLQDAGHPRVRFTLEMPEGPVEAEVDETMLSQALTNLLKNAAEATQSHAERFGSRGYQPRVRARLKTEGETLVIEIEDNGIGLPEDRARLFEPYVTTRDKGTGLGLPIVKKIVEEHGGSLRLEDAPAFEGCAHRGARAVIRLPLARGAGAEAETAANRGTGRGAGDMVGDGAANGNENGNGEANGNGDVGADGRGASGEGRQAQTDATQDGRLETDAAATT